MSEEKNKSRFLNVFPIGDTDTARLPIKEVSEAVAYYTQMFGFSVESISDGDVVMKRDDVVIGLQINDLNPEQASCYFAVSDIDLVHKELTAAGAEPSPIRPETHDGKPYRICFAKEPYGVCFCFGSPTPTS